MAMTPSTSPDQIWLWSNPAAPHSEQAMSSYPNQRSSQVDDRNTNLILKPPPLGSPLVGSVLRRSSNGGGHPVVLRESLPGQGEKSERRMSSVPSRLLLAAFASAPGVGKDNQRERSRSGAGDGVVPRQDEDEWASSGVKRSVSMPRTSLHRWQTRWDGGQGTRWGSYGIRHGAVN